MVRKSLLVGSLLSLGLAVVARGDLVNGGFDAGLSSWSTSGPVGLEDVILGIDGVVPAARLDESELEDITSLFQEFTIPSAPGTLSFTFAMFATLTVPPPMPFLPDALLVYLLDPVTLDPLLDGDGFPDYFAVEFDSEGEVFVDYPDPFAIADLVDLSFGDTYGIGGTVTLDVSSLTGGTDALLQFDLEGGDNGSNAWAFIDNNGVTAIPAPASVVLALLGSSLIAGIRKRVR